MDIKRMTQIMVENSKAYESTGTKPWDARTWIKDIGYQLGGLTKLDMQLHKERHLQGKTIEQIKQEMQCELAEIVSDALMAAHCLDLDIVAGFQQMLDDDAVKIEERVNG